MKETIKALITKFATNPWVVALLAIAQLWDVLYGLVLWCWRYGQILLSAMPSPETIPLPSIDWIDVTAKLLICVLLIVLQRLVIGAKRDQSDMRAQYLSWKESQAQWMDEQEQILHVSGLIQMLRIHRTHGAFMKGSALSVDDATTLHLFHERASVIDLAVKKGYCSSKEEAGRIWEIVTGTKYSRIKEAEERISKSSAGRQPNPPVK